MELKPFPVDPQVMASISPMGAGDTRAVADLHHAAMGTSLWAQLGRPFLAGLYGCLLEDPAFIAFVYREEGEIRGFIAGSEDVGQVYRRTVRRHFPRLVYLTLSGLRHHPRVVRRLFQTARYFQVSAVDPEVEKIKAESLFCSFAPQLRGKRISGHINKVLFDELRYRGHTHVKITTETNNEGAIRQLESWGFERRGTFSFYGKDMVAYVLDLVACPRVEAIRRM